VGARGAGADIRGGEMMTVPTKRRLAFTLLFGLWCSAFLREQAWWYDALAIVMFWLGHVLLWDIDWGRD